MKKNIFLLVALFLIACGDSSSNPSYEDDGKSSSSMRDNPAFIYSSSSLFLEISSSLEKEKHSSSSREKELSSSSETIVESLSSATEQSSITINSSESDVLMSSMSDAEPSNLIESSSVEQSSSSAMTSSSSYFKESWIFLNEKLSYGEIVDQRDNQIYKTIKIAEQEWMAENLNYYDDENAMLQKGSWCYREDSQTCRMNLTCVDSCFKYGRFYTWAAAIDSVGIRRSCGYNGGVCSFSGNVKGLCPEGWHLPDTSEWAKLKVAVKSSMALQSEGFEKWNKATNESGFSMVPIGYYKSSESAYESGSFSQVGVYARFWTASDNLRDVSWHAYAYSSSLGLSSGNTAGVYTNGLYTKKDGFSVRCVKD